MRKEAVSVTEDLMCGMCSRCQKYPATEFINDRDIDPLCRWCAHEGWVKFGEDIASVAENFRRTRKPKMIKARRQVGGTKMPKIKKVKHANRSLKA